MSANIRIDPIRRNLKFVLPTDKVLNWNRDGLHVTQFSTPCPSSSRRITDCP